jgi:lipooligosaccharide transport system ATP-binding protein
MEEAAQLCDRVLILDAGRIIAQGAPSDLVRTYAGRDVVQVFACADEGLIARSTKLASRVERAGEGVLFFLDDGRSLTPLLEALAGCEFTHRAANLEDVFLRLTSRELRD